jgi:REP element-mobilizing transposase RayT
MARPIRIEFSGAVYHVTSRVDRQEDIYDSDDDRNLFLKILGEVCERFNWECHCYCLMSNHYHLLIRTPDANLSQGMRQLNGVYTQASNRAKNRVGHVFQGRYKAIMVEKQNYLVELCRYIVLNPVRARMVRAAKDWPWSSYRATIGQVSSPSWLTTEWMLASFNKKKGYAINGYKKFVSEGKCQPSPWSMLKNQVYLGDDEFVEKLNLLIDKNKVLDEVPSSQRRIVAKPISFYENKANSRNGAIISAYKSGEYSLKVIGEYFDLHYLKISGIINNHKSKT